MEIKRVKMGFKEILKRIKKIEAGLGSDEMVTLIVLENGVESRRTLPIVDAMMMALKQDINLGTSGECKIIGVEEGDEDGFIQAILESGPMDPEEVKRIVETEPVEYEAFKRRND